MKYIAHRGNIEGSISGQENSPHYIDAAIEKGFEVEIDLRKDFYGWGFGHDSIQYRVSWEWLTDRRKNLWIHCKDLESLINLNRYSQYNFHYFFHDSDKATLTSMGEIWLHNSVCIPDYQANSIVVLPEEHTMSHYEYFKKNPGVASKVKNHWSGICSDYIGKYREVFETKR